MPPCVNICFMAKETARNRLTRNGLTFRELAAGESRGFVLRVMDKTVEPPIVTTVVQQPGQETVSTESLLYVRDLDYSHGDGKGRFVPPIPTEAEDPNWIVELLQANKNPLAEVALQHLLEIPAVEE